MQVTGILRNVAVSSTNVTSCLNSGIVPAFTLLMSAFPQNAELMMNVMRTLSKISMDDDGRFVVKKM